MERVFLVGVRLFRNGEGKGSPNSYSIEDEMASNHANGERSNCQFYEQTFQIASTRGSHHDTPFEHDFDLTFEGVAAEDLPGILV
jgi:hypothetical protein